MTSQTASDQLFQTMARYIEAALTPLLPLSSDLSPLSSVSLRPLPNLDKGKNCSLFFQMITTGNNHLIRKDSAVIRSLCLPRKRYPGDSHVTSLTRNRAFFFVLHPCYAILAETGARIELQE